MHDPLHDVIRRRW